MNKEIAPVLDEISAILKKHDMAGLVMVANKTHADFVMEISPSWSCARCEEHDRAGGKAVMLRVRSKLVDYPNREAQKSSITATISTFVGFQSLMTRITEQLDKALVMISRSIKFASIAQEDDDQSN